MTAGNGGSVAGGNGKGNGAGAAPGADEVDAETLARLVRAIDVVILRRRVSLVGYGLALLVVIVGVPLALGLFASTPARFWVMLVPPALAALTLYGFGRYVKRIR